MTDLDRECCVSGCFKQSKGMVHYTATGILTKEGLRGDIIAVKGPFCGEHLLSALRTVKRLSAKDDDAALKRFLGLMDEVKLDRSTATWKSIAFEEAEAIDKEFKPTPICHAQGCDDVVTHYICIAIPLLSEDRTCIVRGPGVCGKHAAEMETRSHIRPEDLRLILMKMVSNGDVPDMAGIHNVLWPADDDKWETQLLSVSQAVDTFRKSRKAGEN